MSVKYEFARRRWLSITLRTLHLVAIVAAAIAIFGGGPHRIVALASMLVTGLGLFAIELWTGRQHWRELAGAFVLLKMLLMLAMILLPAFAAGLFWLLLIASSLISHAPRAFRHKRVLG